MKTEFMLWLSVTAPFACGHGDGKVVFEVNRFIGQHGFQIIQASSVLFLTAFSAVTDWRFRKIYNYATYPAVLFGLAVSYPHFQGSLAGMTGALILFGILRSIGGLGAGDVKLMAAIGAIKGFPFVLYSSFYIISAACVFGLFVLAWKGRLIPAAKWIGGTLLGMAVPGVSRPAMQGEMTTMPFAPAIFIGTAYAIYLETVNGPFTLG